MLFLTSNGKYIEGYVLVLSVWQRSPNIYRQYPLLELRHTDVNWAMHSCCDLDKRRSTQRKLKRSSPDDSRLLKSRQMRRAYRYLKGLTALLLRRLSFLSSYFLRRRYPSARNRRQKTQKAPRIKKLCFAAQINLTRSISRNLKGSEVE